MNLDKQYRPGTRLSRTLLSILSVMGLTLAATSSWAGFAPDVRILPVPRDTKIIDHNCSNLGRLVTITRTVQNYGGDLPAHRDYLFVSEVTDFYTNGRGNDAQLHSGRVYIPAMRGQGLGKPVQVTMVVGTEAFYAKKLAGGHALLVHLVADGVDENSFDIVGDAVSTVRFPAGYCQPRSLMPPSQMHLQRKPAPRNGFPFGSGRTKRVVRPKAGIVHPLPRTIPTVKDSVPQLPAR